MDIGSLTGTVSLEDQLTGQLTIIAGKVKDFAENFDGLIGGLAIGVGVFGAAVAGAIVSVEKLGEEGSKIQGVTNAFDTLAEKAGTTGDALRGNLSDGVRGTVSEMTLMQDTSKLLGSGMKLTTDQALLMGSAARELGKATGGDASSGLEMMSTALVTGRVRGLQQQIGLIDLAAGEQKFAASIGVTVDQLNAAGKLEGKRIAILDATQTYLDRVGASELSFAEKVRQGWVAVEEWSAKLAKAVASSADVNAALDAIKNAIGAAFGGDGKTLLDGIVAGIDAFSRGTTEAIPHVIAFISSTRDLVKTLYDYRTTIEGVVGALVIYNSTGLLMSVASSGLLFPLKLLVSQVEIFGLSVGVSTTATYLWSRATSTAMGAVNALWAVLAANPLVSIAAGIGVVVVALTQLTERSANARLTAETLGAQQDTINKAIKAGAPLAINYADAIAYNNEKYRLATGGVMALNDAIKALQSNTGNTQTQLKDLNDSVIDLANKGKLSSPVVQEVAAAINSMHLKANELPSALKNVVAAASIMNGTLADSKDRFIDSAKGAAAYATAWEAAAKKIAAVWAEAFAVEASLNVDKGQAQVQELEAKRQNELNAAALEIQDKTQLAEMGYAIDAKYAAMEAKLVVDNERSIHDETKKIQEQAFKDQEALIAKLAADNVATFNDEFTTRRAASEKLQDIDLQGADATIRQADRTLQVIKEKYGERAAAGDQLAIDIISIEQQIHDHTIDLTTSIVRSFGDTLQQIPALLQQAFTGGGGFSGAMSALGSLAGKNLGGSIAGKLALADPGMMASALGKTLGAAIPIVGSLIGPALTALFSLGGPSAQEVAGRQTEASFEKQMGGYQGIAKSLTGVGVSAADTNLMITALWNSEKQGSAAVQANIDAINAKIKSQTDLITKGMADIVAAGKIVGTNFPAALQPAIDQLKSMPGLTDAEKASLDALTAGAVPSLQTITDTAKKYGLTLDDLGGKTQQLSISTQADQIETDFKTLTDSGADSNAVIQAMGKSVNALVDDAIKYGSALPTAMKPIVQSMLDAGILTDATGKKINDMSNITFDDTGDPLAKGLQTLTDSINNLVDILSGKVPKAAQDAASGITNAFKGISVDVPVKIGDGAVPTNYANGGVVYAAEGAVIPFTPRGTDVVPAMLTPGERITSAGGVRSEAESQAAILDELRTTRALLATLPGTIITGQRYAALIAAA